MQARERLGRRAEIVLQAERASDLVHRDPLHGLVEVGVETDWSGVFLHVPRAPRSRFWARCSPPMISPPFSGTRTPHAERLLERFEAERTHDIRRAAEARTCFQTGCRIEDLGRPRINRRDRLLHIRADPHAQRRSRTGCLRDLRPGVVERADGADLPAASSRIPAPTPAFMGARYGSARPGRWKRDRCEGTVLVTHSLAR
jgi:hypothetical protein